MIGDEPIPMRHVYLRHGFSCDSPYSGERILEIEVRGKRGVGYCKSMPSAARPE
jgi:hypothetical protein